jgi:hypothetical protein
MATVRRYDGEPQTLEAFEIDLDEGDWEALRSAPERFFRELLEPEYKVNGICVDTRNLGRLARGELAAASFVRLVHISGGPFDSYYVWPEHQM